VTEGFYRLNNRRATGVHRRNSATSSLRRSGGPGKSAKGGALVTPKMCSAKDEKGQKGPGKSGAGNLEGQKKTTVDWRLFAFRK